MADVLVLEFSTPDAMALYLKVNGILGVSPDGSGDWPSPLAHHVAANIGDKLIVLEVWDSKAAQEEFMQSRLGPALHQAEAPQPARVEWFALAGQMHRA